MANIVAPSSFGQSKGLTGHAYVFTGEKIREELTERLDVLNMGLVQGVGDLAGSGSDVIRVSRFGGIGFAERMTSLGESGTVPTTGHTLNNDTVTIGRYGIAKEQTYQEQILGRAEALHLEDMAARIPLSWLSTLRNQVCIEGATFASGVGTTGTALTYDDELSLVASFHETEGYDAATGAVSMRHPEQYTDLRNSIRNEPGLQNDAQLQMALLGLGQGADPAAFPFMGIRNHSSHDVVNSGGDHLGFCYVPGAIAWVVASTRAVEPEDPTKTVFIPEFGIIVERKSTSEQGVAKVVANAWFGVDKLASALFPQFLIRSVND